MKPNRPTRNLVTSIARNLGYAKETGPDGRPLGDHCMPDPRVHDFREQYLLWSLNRKIETSDDSLDASTLANFLEVEAECMVLNRSLLGRIKLSTKRHKRCLLRARQLIADVLGEALPADLLAYASFSGGASTSRTRKNAHVALKWWARPSLEVTPLALSLLMQFKEGLGDLQCVWDFPGDLDAPNGLDSSPSFYKIAKGSRLEMVEKNYKTKRVILIEPDGNMLLQKAAGGYIKHRLLRFGINLFDQSINRNHARMGSIDGSVATLDEKTASDLVTKALVEFLVPQAWYEYFYATRSHITQLPSGDWIPLAKISSMGNGYTFELESLIFWALTQSVVDVLKPRCTTVSVFGDDIVCPSSVARFVMSLLNLVGFQTNEEKSFWTGPFRESCGGHYLRGVDVTPFYIRAYVDKGPEELLRLANQAYAWEGFCGPVTECILRLIPTELRNVVPLEWDETQGIKFQHHTARPMRITTHRKWGTCVKFYTYAPTRINGAYISDECRWLHSIMEGHSLSKEGMLPDRVASDGARGVRPVSMPYLEGVIP